MTVLLPAWLQAGSYNAELDRQVATGLLTPSSALGARGGVRRWGGNELQVTAPGSPSMQVVVKAGMAWVQGVSVSTQGAYAIMNDNDVTLGISAANPTNPRIDRVVLEVLDAAYSGASNLAQLRVVTGTAAVTPVAPTVTGNFIILGEVRVNAAVTTIAAGVITDTRPFAAANGGLLPVLNATARTALSPVVAAWSPVLEIDSGRVYQWNGTGWDYVFGGTPPTVAITPATGWFNWTGTKGGGPWEDLRVTKVNGIVYVTGFLGNTATFTNPTTMFTLPVGYRPERIKVIRMQTGSNAARRVDIYPTGLVQAWPAADAITHKASDWWSVDIHMNPRNNTLG